METLNQKYIKTNFSGLYSEIIKRKLTHLYPEIFGFSISKQTDWDNITEEDMKLILANIKKNANTANITQQYIRRTPNGTAILNWIKINNKVNLLKEIGVKTALTFEDCKQTFESFLQKDKVFDKTKFSVEHSGVYKAAVHQKWLSQIYSELGLIVVYKNNNDKWTFEEIQIIASKFKNSLEWNNQDSKSCDYARRKKWFEKVTSHFEPIQKKSGFWTFEKVQADAARFNTLKEWKANGGSGARFAATKNGWYKEVTKHFITTGKPKGFWKIFENVKTDALNFNTPEEWKTNSKSAVASAYKNGWYKDVTKHFNINHSTSPKYTKEASLELAKNYKENGEQFLIDYTHF